MIPVDKQMQLIKRGITNLIDEGELRKKLERGKPLIVHGRQAHADVYGLPKKFRPQGHRPLLFRQCG